MVKDNGLGGARRGQRASRSPNPCGAGAHPTWAWGRVLLSPVRWGRPSQSGVRGTELGRRRGEGGLYTSGDLLCPGSMTLGSRFRRRRSGLGTQAAKDVTSGLTSDLGQGCGEVGPPASTRSSFLVFAAQDSAGEGRKDRVGAGC